MDYAELINDFLDDSNGQIAAFDSALMSFERGVCGKDLITDTLGVLHTLKGNSGMMGYDPLKSYIHELEEILRALLEGEKALSDVLQTLLEGSNVIRSALKEIERNPSACPGLEKEISALGTLSGGAEGNGRALDLSSYLGARTNTIKVDFKKLDDLLSLVGELVIFKTRLGNTGAALKGADRLHARDFKETLEGAGKIIAALQEGVMKARMMPVGSLFGKFTRLVRDLAKSQGKDVRLGFRGEETELDKTVLDQLREPLLHLIRNSIDHGIEPPEERGRKGKPPAGSLLLSAWQESNCVTIRVEDDGKGIDLEEIRGTAVKKGLVAEDGNPGKNDLFSILFMAGFSTRAESTDISGRGIGLDIVSRDISRLSGQIAVESEKDRGAAFIIKIPLSLAIIPALMARVAGEVFAIPVSSVEESVKIAESEIHMVNNREVVKLRQKVVPVLRLEEFFGLEGGRKGKNLYLVVVGRAEKRMALAVDALKGQQEIVIKPLDETFGRTKGIAGGSILGDGKIVLILDVTGLWEKGFSARGDGLAGRR